jgi:hypothetical protein
MKSVDQTRALLDTQQHLRLGRSQANPEVQMPSQAAPERNSAYHLAIPWSISPVPGSIQRVILCFAIVAAATAPVSAQTQKKPAANPSDQLLKKEFRDGFLKGCLKGKTTGVKSQPAYCNCVANGYQARYDGQTLTTISQVAGQIGERGPALVNLMMAPETKACAARS